MTRASNWHEAQAFLDSLGVPEDLGINFGHVAYGGLATVARIGTPCQEQLSGGDSRRWRSWGHYSPGRWPWELAQLPERIEVGIRFLGFTRCEAQRIEADHRSGWLSEAEVCCALLVDWDSNERRTPPYRWHYAPTITEAHDLATSVLPPTSALDSGGGVACTYVIDPPVVIPRYQSKDLARLARRFVSPFKRAATDEGYNFDSPPAATSWTRLPGAATRYGSHRVTVLARGPSYSITDIEEFVPAVPRAPLSEVLRHDDVDRPPLVVHEQRRSPMVARRLIRRREPPPPGDGSTTWGRQIPLGAIVDEPPRFVPGILYRSDGLGLLYPAHLNTLVAASWVGKSMVALEACRTEMALGHHVGYFDMEASEEVQVSRLRKMGVQPDQIVEQFHYYQPEDRLLPMSSDDTAALTAQAEFIETMRYCSLGVIDAKGEALVNERALLKDAEPTIAYARMLSKVADESGAALLLLDHPPAAGRKDGYGSVYNVNTIRGTILHMEASIQFRPGEIGTARLLVRKDRHAATLLGGTPQEDGRIYIGEVILDGTGALSWTDETAITVTIEPPGNESRPASLVTRLRELIKTSTDDDPITSIEQARTILKVRKAEAISAYDWLESSRQVGKVGGRFVWLADAPQTSGVASNDDDD